MKKVLTILFILMLIVSIFQINHTYAKYKTEKSGEYESLLGVWSIKLNEIDISSGEALEFDITENNLTVDEEYVAANKIAPGISGYFDLTIDPTGTDVAIIYDIQVKSDEIDQSQYKITSIDNIFQNPNDENDKITNTQSIMSNGVHKAIMPLDKINAGYINFVRVNFEWTNSETNNESDTELGTSGTSSIDIPVEVSIKQYMGEVLE